MRLGKDALPLDEAFLSALPQLPSPSAQTLHVLFLPTTARRIAVIPRDMRAFERSNLRWNPFGEASFDDRRELALVRVPAPIPGTHLQIIGDAGHGKTSSLLALLGRIDGARYVYVPDAARADTPWLGLWRIVARLCLDRRGPLLVDEAQRLPRWAVALLSTRADTLVVATHDDLRADWRRPIATVELHTIEPAFVDDVIAARLRWARRREGPTPKPTADLLRSLRERHGACVRALEAELYFHYQNHDGLGDVEG